MEILTQLGINKTIWIQLAFFIISYLAVSQLIFKPYSRNLKFRKKQTVDAAAEANKVLSHADVLAIEYEEKLKNQNEKILHLFGQLKSEGVAEEHKLLLSARQNAEKVLNQANQKITQEVALAKKELQQKLPEFSKAAASKLLGRSL
ncbi:MAG: hypothetical protein IPM57_04435 [Oligoflexia bacterium]|nr:hypothetical protein [Oligoflexia bacterium]